MALNLPENAEEVINRARADVQAVLPQSNPFLKNSWLGALATAIGSRSYDFFLQLRAAIKENFPDTASGSFLERWAAIWGKQKLAATKATGNVVASGTIGAAVPVGSVFTTVFGNYISKTSAVISSQTVNITSLTRSGSTVTAVTSTGHLLSNNIAVTITGASNSEYNVSNASIIITAADSFQYQIVGTPPDELATSAVVNFVSCNIPVESDGFGSSYNLDAGHQLTLQSPISGVDDKLFVDFGAIGGGTNQEGDDGLRARTLDRIQNPIAHFNVSAITEAAKEIAGVTRVFVQEITPDIGQVTIYFMRDNDPNPIPTSSEVLNVKNNILKLKPANTADIDVIVSSPTGVVVNFQFSSITPDTQTMRDSIEENLRQFFDEKTQIGINIDQDAYRSAIFNTVDIETGDTLSTFTLSSPVGDIVMSSGDIGVLGTVGY